MSDCATLWIVACHGILQVRILECVAMLPPPGDLPDPGIEPMSLTSPALAGMVFTTVPPEHFPPKKAFPHYLSGGSEI